MFSILPFGADYLRIIISGSKTDFFSVHSKLSKEDFKVISLTGFTDSEVSKYLGVPDSSLNSITDLYKVTKGYPGRLKTLKRLMQNEGYSLEQISGTTTYNTWLELDCESVDLSISQNNVIVSLLCLSEHSFSCEEVAKICLLSIEECERIVSELSIIDHLGKYVSIASSAHRRYLSNLLRGNKQNIDELLIAYYAEVETLNSLIDLPKLYVNKKEWGKVIQLLDEQYFNKILEKTGSLKIVNETLELGVQASEKSNRYSDLLRYSIQGSIVNELDNYLFWESEIEARISISDFIGAISLAESAIVLVDRLRLLALIARRQKEFNNKVDEVLINLIQELYNTIDLAAVGEKIYDIVAHLIYALPNLAIEMIEKSSGGSSNNNINDWVVAKLSIAAIDSSLKEEEKLDSSKKLEVVQNLNNPSVKKINRAISFLVGNYSSIKVLEEVQKITEGEERLKLLRLWLANNRSDVADIEKVIDVALQELVLLSSETSLTIEVLNELSSQLPFVRNSNARKLLYGRFKSIENDLLDLGLVKSKYIYQLNMFHAEFYLDRDKSVHTINRIIKEIDVLSDVLVKLDSYSETFSKLCLINDNVLFNKKANFVYNRIIDLSKSLFETTASQFKVSTYFLRTIGKRNPTLALEIIRQMNNIDRRERARLLVLDSYLDNNLKYVEIDLLRKIEDDLEEISSKETLCIEILERYAEAKSLHYKVIFLLLYFGNKVKDILNLNERIKGFTLIYKIINKNETWKEKLTAKFESQIYNTWKNLEADWEKIDQGFTLCYQLSKSNVNLSRKIFEESEQLKRSSWLDSKLVAFTYLNSINIVARAYYGLLISHKDVVDDYRIVSDLIDRIPSEIQRLRLWTEVGFYAHAAQRIDIAKKITNDHVILIMHGLIAKKIDIEPALDAITLIHISDSGLAMSYLNKLPSEPKEVAICNICDYYVTKRHPFDVYDKNGEVKYSSTFSDLSKSISILDLINDDGNVYALLHHISKAIQFNKETIVKAQVSTLISDLKIIIDRKFPDPRNIKHEGYKIISLAMIAKIDKSIVDQNIFWNDLLDRAGRLPNLSDVIFVRSILIDEIPFDKLLNGASLKLNVYESITKGLDLLPAHYEFVQRVIDISENMFHVDRNAWKKFVDRAFSLSGNLKDGSDVYASQRSIIDSMYRLDPSYAKDLIKQLDKENQQNKINKLLHKHYETLEIADKIKNSKTLEQKEKENSRAVVNSLLVALRGMNSDRIGTKKVSEVSAYLSVGNKLPLHEVMPIYMYYLNNCAKTYKSASDGVIATLHRDNFRESVNATNLVQILSQKKKTTEKSYRKFFIDEEFSTNKPVKPKSKEIAFNFIRDWLSEQAEEFLIIADPYFEKQDLEILKIIKETVGSIDIDILGSKMDSSGNIEQDYNDYWKEISDEAPPFVNITFCKTQDSKETPFHDRWIISKNGGLRLGTSINSLGIKKESELSVMKPNEALRIREDTLMEYINRRKKEFNNQRLFYKSFSL